MTNTTSRPSFELLPLRASLAPRDSGIVDIRDLTGGATIRFAPLDAPRPLHATALPSPGRLAAGLLAFATLAMAALVGRANYVAHVNLPLTAPTATITKAPKPIIAEPPAAVIATTTPAESAPAATSAPPSPEPAVTTSTRSAATRPATSTTRPATSTTTAPEPSAPRSLEELMASASAPAATPATPSAPAAASLPTTPARADVSRALTAFNSAVQSCGVGTDGTAMVHFVFNGATGRATSAKVTGALASTPTAACVERTVAGAKVPAFSQSSFTVNFPYRV